MIRKPENTMFVKNMSEQLPVGPPNKKSSMGIFPACYELASRLFKYDLVKRVKRRLRPFKWFLFGKEGLYKAIEHAIQLAEERSIAAKTVFDIGAADGDYSLTFAKLFPQAEVFCFEPQTVSYDRLARTVKDLFPRVKIFKFGFYDQNTTAKLNLNVSHPDGSSLTPPAGVRKSHGPGPAQSQLVELRRLDDFVRENQIERIFFLKIDVEGVEKEVLLGGLETIKNKVDNIFIEIGFSIKDHYSPYYIDVLRILNQAGFSLLSITENENFFFSKLV